MEVNKKLKKEKLKKEKSSNIKTMD